MLIDIIAKHTGQDAERVSEDSERDKYFSAEEAKAVRLVDEVLVEPPKSPCTTSLPAITDPRYPTTPPPP